MHKPIKFRMEGVAPLLMHNGNLADPLNEHAKAMKAITSKRSKTDEDHLELKRLEFLGSLYVDEKQRPIIPGENIEAMLIKAAKQKKRGEAFKAGVLCDGRWPIEYEGPKEAAKLWDNAAFVDQRSVVVQRNRIIRTRPKFSNWSLEVELMYVPDVVSKQSVVEAMDTAGKVIGLGDYKPKFGRFEVKEMNNGS